MTVASDTSSFREVAGFAVGAMVPGMALAVTIADVLGANTQGLKDAAFLGMTAGPIALLIEKALKPVKYDRRLAAMWVGTALMFGAVTGSLERPVRSDSTHSQSAPAKLAK